MNISTTVLDKIRLYVSQKVSAHDPAHSYDHIMRVVNITKQLCKHYEKADPLLAEMIALLHEMRDDKLFSETQIDELSEFMFKLSLSEELVQLILESITLISYRKYPTLFDDVILEVKIVQDADRIDAIGAIGIARTFAYGGAKGYALYSDDPNQPGVIQHFNEKLLLIFELLNTDAAKAYAIKRHEFIKTFYIHFMQELNETYDKTN